MLVSVLKSSQHHCVACSVIPHHIRCTILYVSEHIRCSWYIFCTTPMTFCYCQGIRGLKHLTPQTPKAYCKIHDDRGITIRNEGKNYRSVLPAAACRGTTASRPPGWGEPQSGSIPPAKYKLCKVAIFRGCHIPSSNPNHCWQPIGILRFSVHCWALKSAQR